MEQLLTEGLANSLNELFSLSRDTVPKVITQVKASKESITIKPDQKGIAQPKTSYGIFQFVAIVFMLATGVILYGNMSLK